MTTSLTEGFDTVTRYLVMGRDLNAYGYLFGGKMLSWLDESGAIYVMESIGYNDIVTISMDDVRFHAPAHLGDAVSIYSRILQTGRSSVTIQSRAFVLDPMSNRTREVIDCRISYVCLKKKKPFAYFKSRRYLKRLSDAKKKKDSCE